MLKLKINKKIFFLIFFLSLSCCGYHFYSYRFLNPKKETPKKEVISKKENHEDNQNIQEKENKNKEEEKKKEVPWTLAEKGVLVFAFLSILIFYIFEALLGTCEKYCENNCGCEENVTIEILITTFFSIILFFISNSILAIKGYENKTYFQRLKENIVCGWLTKIIIIITNCFIFFDCCRQDDDEDTNIGFEINNKNSNLF